MSTKISPPKGWGRPAQSRKFHYFNNDSFSLCRRYGFYYGYAEDEYDDHAENCTECKRLKAKLNTAKPETGGHEKGGS